MTPGEKSNLSAQLSRTLQMIDAQIGQIRSDAGNDKTLVDAYKLRDSNGQYLMTPLLIARAQILLAITELKVTM